MEVGIAVEVGYFLIFKREAYLQSLKFTQVSIDICISLQIYLGIKSTFYTTAFMVWVIQLYEGVILLHENLVSNFLCMEGGIRPWRLDFLAQINKYGLRVY